MVHGIATAAALVLSIAGGFPQMGDQRSYHSQYLGSIADCRILTNSANRSIDVSVSCPKGLPYRISLLQSPRCGPPRSLSSPYQAKGIHYFLLTPKRTGIWCDGTNGTEAIEGTGTGGTQHYVASACVLERTRLETGGMGKFFDTVTVYVEKR